MAFRYELDALFTEIKETALDQLRREWELASNAANNRGPYAPPVEAVPLWAKVEHDFYTYYNAYVAPWQEQFESGDRDTFQVLTNGLHDDNGPRDAGEYSPNYVEYAGVTDSIAAAKSTVTVNVTGALATWNGGAATTFRLAFLGNFGPAADNQLALVRCLGGILRAYQSVLGAGQDAVLEIARAAVNALGALDDSKFKGRDFIFLVVGSVASIAGAPPAAGATITALDFITGRALDSEDKTKTEGTVAGGTVYEVLASMGQELSNLSEIIDTEESRIGQAVTTARNSLSADLNEANEYLAVDMYLGGNINEFDMDTNTVAVEAADLYYTGNVDMSAAAYNYDHAVYRLGNGAANESGAFGTWFGKTVGHYQALRESFSTDVLAVTRDHLIEYGAHLCNAAILYAETDHVTAEQVMAEFNETLDRLEQSGEGLPDTLNNRPPVPSGRIPGQSYY